MTQPDSTISSARAAVYLGPGQIEIQRLKLPVLKDDDMLVEVQLCGVDGSELKWYRGELDWLNARAPVIFGDEILGRVSGIGAAAARQRGLEIGDRVVIESRWPCEQGCRTCSQGQYYLCENRPMADGYGTMGTATAGSLWGGYATHVFVPRLPLVYRVPADLPDQTALIAASPLANGIRWFEGTGARIADHVVIIGPGPQGLCTAIAGVTAGARVTLMGLPHDTLRLEEGRRFGVSATFEFDPAAPLDQQAEALIAAQGPVDAVVEVTGSASGKAMAVKLVRPLGTIVTAAASPHDYPTDWRSLHLKEVTLVGRLSHPHTVPRALRTAQRLLEQGMDVGDLITHVYPLDAVAKAIEVASYATGETPLKVALAPQR